MAQIVGDFTEFVKQIIIDENISQGPQGDVGATGPEGPQGIAGVQGNTGDKGDSVTVTDIQSNPDYSITLTFSDGTVFTSDPIRGAKGEQGDTGLQGTTGPQGNDGVDGDNLTVTSVTNNNDNTITIVFSDGTSHNTGVIKGDRGDQGEDGPRGIQGIQGIQGIEGQKGEKGDQGQSVHHVTAVGTTDPEGDFQTPGETDTYVMYGDADETINIGGFEVRNGDDAYSYVTKYGYTGTAQEFGEALTNFADLVNTGVVSSFNGRDGNVALTNSDITDAVGVDLSGVEAGATADQTAGEIAALYESIIGTEKYTTVDKAKVGHIAVTQHVDLDLLEISAASNNAHTLRVDNPHSVTKAQVGLDQVDNTSDVNKPISNATQTALNSKADNATTLAGYGITDADTSAEVDAKIAGLVDAAPSTLDTLNELATALGDDPNFAATTAAQIGTKQDQLVNQVSIKSINGDTLLGSGDLTIAAGSGGYAAALYFSDVVSTVEGSYKTLSYTPDVAETTVAAVVIGGGGEQLMETYLFSLPIRTTVIDAGKWTANFYGSVDNDNGDTRLRYEGFMKEDGTGVETTLFTSTSPELTTAVGHIEFEVTEPVKVVSATARYGIRVYASTTSNSNKTVSYVVGDGNASNTNTPLATRHDQLRARDAVDQHPISAITGLQAALDGKVLKTGDTITGDLVIQDAELILKNVGTINDLNMVADGSYNRIYRQTFRDSAVLNLDFIQSSRGTELLPVALLQNDIVYEQRSMARNGTGFTTNAKFKAVVDDTPTATETPVGYEFEVADNLGVKRQVKFKSNGNVGIGTNNPESKLHINLFDGYINTEAKIKADAEFKVHQDGFNTSDSYRSILSLDTSISEGFNAGFESYFNIKSGSSHQDGFNYTEGYNSEINSQSDIDVSVNGNTIATFDKDSKLLVNTTGLPNATADHKLQVNGIPMHGLIWKDLIAEFIPARGGAINEPAWSDIGNGIVMSSWTSGEELPVAYHVNHDYALGTDAYPHIHFMCADAQSAGAQVTWRFSYVVARGHSQGGSLTAATTDIDMTYTYTGSEVPGEHIVLECSDIQAFDLLEPDTVVLAQVTLLSENVAGAIYGIQADLHYQANVEGTISKSPDFTVA